MEVGLFEICRVKGRVLKQAEHRTQSNASEDNDLNLGVGDIGKHFCLCFRCI